MIVCFLIYVIKSIVTLVTFQRNKYMTAETFKTGFGIRNKRKWDTLIQPRIYVQYFVESAFRSFLYLFYEHSHVVRVKWRVKVSLINISHIHGRKKTTSTWHLTLLENFTVMLIGSKNSESDVRSITIHAIQSWSDRNDSSWKLIL